MRRLSVARYLTSVGAVLTVAIGAPAAVASNSGVLATYVVTPISSSKILAETVPPQRFRSDRLQIVGCRGQYEVASVVLRASAMGVRAIELAMSELIDPESGSRISRSNVDLRVVKPWFQSRFAWREIGKSHPGDFSQTMVPELLLKDDSLVVTDNSSESNFVRLQRHGKWQYTLVNPKSLAPSEQVLPTPGDFPVQDSPVLRSFDIPSDSSKQIWITVHIPDDAASGSYSGQLEVLSGGIALATMQMVVRIPAVDLADPIVSYSVYYRAQLDDSRASIGSEYRNRAQMTRELADMREHGIASPTVYQDGADAKGLRSALELRQQALLGRGPLYAVGIQTTDTFLGIDRPQQAMRLRQVLPELVSLAKEFGYSTLYVYGKDEARGDALLAQRKLWTLVRQMGARVFAAGYADAYGLVGDTLDLLVSAGQPDYREASRWHSRDKRIFSYANPQSGPENPYLFRLNYGPILWANNYDGAMVYAYQHCFGACWNDIDHPVYRDHNLTYPTVDGVIPTLAWEGLRQGINDVRYLTTLEAMVREGKRGSAAERVAANSFIDSTRAMLRLAQNGSGKYNASATVDLDLLRSQTLVYLEALARPSGEP